MALDVGGPNSRKRNEAFEVLKSLTATIGYSRPWSAYEFRNMSRTSAAAKRREVRIALQNFARDYGVTLSNSGDPLADLRTARRNLEKVQAVAPPVLPAAEDTFYDNGETDESFYSDEGDWLPENGTDDFYSNGDGDGGWEDLPQGAKAGIIGGAALLSGLLLYRLARR